MPKHFENIRTAKQAENRFKSLVFKMRYFRGVHDSEAAKVKYRAQANELHPDKETDDEKRAEKEDSFKKMTAEHELWQEIYSEYKELLIMIDKFPEMIPKAPVKKKPVLKRMQKVLQKPENKAAVVEGSKMVMGTIFGAFVDAVIGNKKKKAG